MTTNEAVFEYNDYLYPIRIVRKNNKNTYLRVKDKEIIITTNYFVTTKQIEKLIRDNEKSLIRMISIDNKKMANKQEEGRVLSLFGSKYNIIYGYDNFSFDKDNIYVLNEYKLKNYLDKEILFMFSNRLDYWFNVFEETIPKPNLKIRKMKTRWGVCNLGNSNVTLNYDLYKYDSKCLDYVIVHELSHFIYPNHSKNFWLLVNKYCPDYKNRRKILKG